MNLITPLHYACEGGSVCWHRIAFQNGMLMFILLKVGLHLACINDKVECAEMLLKYGANINSLDEDKETPLHNAYFIGNIACTKLLLKMDANVHTHEGVTKPLHLSYLEDKGECAECYLNMEQISTSFVEEFVLLKDTCRS
ncbi:hypothetical protein CEXT_265481 [Caerostris extrusa]|uniref:Uncharacterized protein n=1 Tax=Caerostris extrusa TaxID=172846 RepID=A0AAV4XRM8_CAEEX|nr:hypothetical protein CEXT_265481 [Caerostris extrusa]